MPKITKSIFLLIYFVFFGFLTIHISGSLQLANAASQSSWDFNTDGNLEGWTYTNVESYSVSGGIFYIDPSTQNDPYIVSPSISVSASSYNAIRIKMASNASDGTGAIYFITSSSSTWNESKKVSFKVSNHSLTTNAPYSEYIVYMRGNSYWSGTITGIRIDPADYGTSGNADTIGFDYIKFENVSRSTPSINLYFNTTSFSSGDSQQKWISVSGGSGYTVNTYVRATKPDGTKKYVYYDLSGTCTVDPNDTLVFTTTKTPLYKCTWEVKDSTWNWNNYTFTGSEDTGTWTWEFWYEDVTSPYTQIAYDSATYTVEEVDTGTPPTVTTNSATNVTASTATLNGTVNANNLSTTALFEYGKTSGSYSDTTSTQNVSGSGNKSISASINGLSASTTYYYRVVAQNSAGTSYGGEKSFTTSTTTSTQTSWDFNTDGDLEGWTYTNVESYSVSGGIFYIDPSTQNDPYIVSPSISVSASSYNAIRIRMASNASNGTGTIYFITSSSSTWNESKKVSFKVSNHSLTTNAPYSEYIVYMKGNSYWSGTITGIRIDPADYGTSGNSDTIGFDFIQFENVSRTTPSINLYFNNTSFSSGDSQEKWVSVSGGSGYTVNTYVRVTKPDGTKKYVYYDLSGTCTIDPNDSLVFTTTKTPLYKCTWEVKDSTWNWNNYTFTGSEDAGTWTWEFWYEDVTSPYTQIAYDSASYTVEVDTCTYSISSTNKHFGSNGGSSSVSVTTSSNCSWSATSNASWITITSGSSGTGNGTVNYSVSSNTSTSDRTGTMTIAGQTFTVTQDGKSQPTPTPKASPEPSPSTENTPPVALFTMISGSQSAQENETLYIEVLEGESATVDFSADRSYDPDGFITTYEWKISGTIVSYKQNFTYDLGEGTHDIFLTVTDDLDETGSVGGTVVVNETLCSYTISPTSKHFEANGGSEKVSVRPSSNDCEWTAKSNTSWITITSGSSGTGNGTVAYTVSANSGTKERKGAMTIAGETFTVTQEGASGTTPSPTPKEDATISIDYPVDEDLYEPGSYAGRSFYYDKVHLGEDIKLNEGIPIKAIADGKIVQYEYHSGYATFNDGTSIAAVIEHDLGETVTLDLKVGHTKTVSVDKICSIYGHIRKSETYSGSKLPWKVGDYVKIGEIIGYINDDDHNGDGKEHLHMGIRLGAHPGYWVYFGYENTTKYPDSSVEYFAAASEIIENLSAEPFPSTPVPSPTPTTTPSDENLLKKYAPILYMHSEERLHPTSVEVMLENSELYEKICKKEKKDGTCEKYKGVPVEKMKNKELTLDTLMDKYNDDKYYLKLKDKAEKKAKKKEWKERQTVYSRQTTDTDEDGKEKTILQYWFFYVYNDWQNNHEGDWEMIQIILDSEEQPERITFGFHHGGKTFEWDEKDEDGEYKVRKSKNDNHPFVYVTLGGHGCWNHAGENKWYQIDTTYDSGGCLDCIDNTSEDGDILFPSTMRETEISDEQTNNKKYSYTIEDITDLKNENSDWIYWEGYWGEQSKKKLNGKDDAGKSGPPSPPHIDYIYTLLEKQGRWYEPIQWADDPLPSVYTVCSSANSKIIVNNSLSLFSNSCNPISDYDPFNYDECTSGCSNIMKIISVENIVFNIFSLDGEEITLKISRYNRDTKEVHEVEFDWLEIPKNGKATLKFSPQKNPDFKMKIDRDLDGFVDDYRLPNYFNFQ